MNRPLSLMMFVVGWAACLWGAATGHSLLGPLVVGVLLIAQSLLMADPARALGLIAVVGIVGTVIDSSLIATGVYSISEGQIRVTPLCPLWVTALWVNLGMAVYGWLAWLRGHPFWASVAGALGAPTAYGAAYWTGTIRVLPELGFALLLFAIIGAVVLPLLVWLGQSPMYRERSTKQRTR